MKEAPIPRKRKSPKSSGSHQAASPPPWLWRPRGMCRSWPLSPPAPLPRPAVPAEGRTPGLLNQAPLVRHAGQDRDPLPAFPAIASATIVQPGQPTRWHRSRSNGRWSKSLVIRDRCQQPSVLAHHGDAHHGDEWTSARFGQSTSAKPCTAIICAVEPWPHSGTRARTPLPRTCRSTSPQLKWSGWLSLRGTRPAESRTGN